MEVQRQGAERCVVGVRKGVDDQVERVTADRVIFVFCRLSGAYFHVETVAAEGSRLTGCLDERLIVL